MEVLFYFCSGARIRTWDHLLTRTLMFPKGVDYIIAVARHASDVRHLGI